jgi:hypothetical protein
MYALKGEKRAALAFDRVDRVSLFSARGDAATPSAPLAHLRHASGFTATGCASRGDGGTLFEVEKGTCDHVRISGNIPGNGQQEIRYVPALPDGKVFEDFDTEIKYSVSQGEKIQGLYAHALNNSPLPVDFKIDKPGYLQLCLLILNDSPVPEKVLVKYQGITQEFLIDWKHWGWAPISLLRQYATDQEVHFEIMPAEGRGDLKISKVYLRYQDVKRTD